MHTLNDIKTQYGIPQELFDNLRIAIKYDHSKNYNDVIQFMAELPHKLQVELALQIHKDIRVKIEFFNHKEENFIAWIGPLLKPSLVGEFEYVYHEEDKIRESKACLS